jgi:bisphosphoglycerate-independent phosphoglycerate mutase (AlkP superfamily)
MLIFFIYTIDRKYQLFFICTVDDSKKFPRVTKKVVNNVSCKEIASDVDYKEVISNVSCKKITINVNCKEITINVSC